MALDLSNIGTPQELFNTTPSSPLAKFLLEWAQGRIDAMVKDAPKATGALSQSIAPEFQAGKLTITMDEYWNFQDQGVDGIERKFGSPYSFKHLKPSRKMVDAIVQGKWMASKGMSLRENQTIEQAAWAIATSVKKKGIEPTRFFSNNMTDEIINQLTTELADRFGEAIGEIITRKYGSNSN